MSSIRCEAAIVGAGVAGLTAALALPPTTGVVVLSKTALGSGAASAWAQGGIAAAIGDDDRPALHAADTLRVGAGIGDESAVRVLADGAADGIARLRALGAIFDATGAAVPALGLEAGHSRRRIVKAGGDATGAEVLRALAQAVRGRENVRVIEYAHADDAILDDDRALGIYAHDVRTREAFSVRAGATILATGGCGHAYAATTNPSESTGDGIALAARAGALLSDMEFVQFHPTALAVGLDPLPLISEAIRGEGAVLLDDLGERFMPSIHPDGELAPRDVVARAIFERQRGGRIVVLDAREAIGARFEQMFPTAFAACMAAGIDPRVAPIPVTPAAHYTIGGVTVDGNGRSSLAGLWACGETAATGVHGANRLASNSLLEALVFARRVADDIAGTASSTAEFREVARPDASVADDAAAIARLRASMYAHVGVERSASGLLAALAQLAEPVGGASVTLANLVIVGRLIAQAALDRRESRGCHYRTDFPQLDPRFAQRSFERLEPARV